MTCLDDNYYLFVFIYKEHNSKYMFLLRKKKHQHLMLRNLELFLYPFVTHIPLQNLLPESAYSRAFLESVCFPLFLSTLSTFVQDSVLSLEFGQ